MPVQFHTGFGDPDLDLRLGNPLYMRSLLEDRRFRNAPIVLLHASYPYAQEAGYLSSFCLSSGLSGFWVSRALLERSRDAIDFAAVAGTCPNE